MMVSSPCFQINSVYSLYLIHLHCVSIFFILIHLHCVPPLSIILHCAPSLSLIIIPPSLDNINTVFTNVYQVEEHSIDIQNPIWDASLSKLVKTVAFKLGIRPADLTAKLDMLLYMEKGSSIDWCTNVEEDENIIGSMLIQLPSVFTGGKISVFDGGEDVDEEDEANFITSFNMGESNNEAEFTCHVVCHYLDCQYEIEEITSGSRVLLRYSLVYNNDGENPTAELLHRSVIPLKQSLTYLPRVDRMLLVPLKQHYSTASLAVSGFDALAPNHRAIAESIRLAGGDNWTVLIMNAVNTYTTQSENDVNGHGKVEIFSPFDQEGTTVYNKWMKKIFDFNPFGGEKGGGMLLSTSETLSDNWGPRKARKRKTIHHGHDSYGYDSEDWYGGYHVSYEYTSTYRATFLLAYDKDSFFELKCSEASKGISGRIVRNDGVIAAAKEIIENQDCRLLGRLLDVVEVKGELCFDTSTCCKLLEMMILHSSDYECTSSSSLASRILGALSTSEEPDSVLWNTIVTSVEKFKWSDLRANVNSLLSDESRKKDDKYSSSSNKSRISLAVFLNRVDFCLRLNTADADVEANFAPKCIAESMKDLASTNSASFGLRDDLLKEKINSMVETYGWKAMAEVFKHSVEFFCRHVPSIRDCLEMGCLVSDLHGSHSCSITLDAITSFAETFSSNMQKFSYYSLRNYCISNRDSASMMTSIRVVIEHGKRSAMDTVGKRLISYRSVFSSFLKAASKLALDHYPQNFLLNALNKLIVQQSIDLEVPCGCSRGNRCECRWNVTPATENDATEDNITVSPSLHVKMTLDENQKLAYLKDKNNRLPLHYAAARGVYETVAFVLEANPQAAIIQDPVTGLYPFMLAGSNGNTAAAFDLLLSEPNLVLGGILADQDEDDADEENVRKRKRSPSM
jgi:hypothetical protein